MRRYIPTYPLVCLAAQYSERVYDPPSGSAERNTHVDADWRTGTKAMVIKSVPMDYMNTIVLAIRGTATFMDWAVNLKMDPTSPAGFLVCCSATTPQNLMILMQGRTTPEISATRASSLSPGI